MLVRAVKHLAPTLRRGPASYRYAAMILDRACGARAPSALRTAAAAAHLSCFAEFTPQWCVVCLTQLSGASCSSSASGQAQAGYTLPCLVVTQQPTPRNPEIGSTLDASETRLRHPRHCSIAWRRLQAASDTGGQLRPHDTSRPQACRKRLPCVCPCPLPLGPVATPSTHH